MYSYAQPAATYAPAPAATASVAAPATSVAAPATTYAQPQMSYMPPNASQFAHAMLDEKVIATQKTDAIAALNSQAKLQADMLSHQYTAQTQMLEAESTRNITVATQQFK